MRRLVLGLAVVMLFGGASAMAQAPCGGLVCDLGIVHSSPSSTSLPCNDFVCRAFGYGRQAEAAPPPPPPEPAPEPKTPTQSKKHHAKVAARTVAPETK